MSELPTPYYERDGITMMGQGTPTPFYQRDGITIYVGDNSEILPRLDTESVSAVVSDPPSGISFMNAKWDSHKGGRDQWIAWLASVLSECKRVMLPGAHALIWALPRTSGWTSMAIEDAGLDVRDCITHLFGSGFPKSHDVSKAIDKANGKYAVDLVPFGEYVRGRRQAKGLSLGQLDDLMGTNTAASWWEGRKSGVQLPSEATYHRLKVLLNMDSRYDELIAWEEARREVIGQKRAGIATPGDVNRHTVGGSRSVDVDITAPATPEAAQWQGWGTALKPAAEFWYLARNPFKGTVAAQVLATGTGAINVDACRIDSNGEHQRPYQPTNNERGIYGKQVGFQPTNATGRWPSNIILDEEAAAMLDAQSGVSKSGVAVRRNGNKGKGMFPVKIASGSADVGFSDTGGASRYFKVVAQDAECLVCARAYEPKHGIMRATERVAPCDHASSAKTSSPLTDQDSGSAHDPAPARLPLENGGSSQSSNGRASTAVSSSGSTQPTRTPIAADDALDSLTEHLARLVSDVESLCATCTTAIARSLASLYHSREVLPVGQDGISERSAQILNRNLALLAESLGSTDTTPTTASMTLWFGSVRHAMSQPIPASDTVNESGLSRLKYCPKASRRERNAGLDGMPERTAGVGDQRASGDFNQRFGHTDKPVVAANHHPTVKPLALMRYLIQMITPPGGVILDPFTGSGSTLVAAAELGFHAIGIELDPEYAEIAARRVDHVLNERAKRLPGLEALA